MPVSITNTTPVYTVKLQNHGSVLTLLANSIANIGTLNVANLYASKIYANSVFGTPGYVLTSNGSGMYWGPIVSTDTTSAGSNGNIQYNNSGGLGGNSNLNWNNANNILYVNGSINIGNSTYGIISNTATLFLRANTNRYISLENTIDTLEPTITIYNESEFLIVTPTNISFSDGAYIDSTSYTGSANNTTYVGGLTSNQLIANAATAYTNAVSYTDSKSFVNTSQLNSNLASYVTGTNLTNNLANYQTTSGLASNVATLTANNTSFVGSISTANVVSNTQLQSNLANYVTSTNLTNNLTNYQTTAGLSANVAKLTANDSTNFSGQPQSYYTNATNQTSGTLNYARIPANVVNTTSNFTITGIYTHSANITMSTGAVIIANGTPGTAGQLLTSNGTSLYWSSVTGGGGGTVTQVDTGSGLTGGPINVSGTVSVLPNTGIIANTSGLYVNSTHIATLTSNNTSFVGTVSAANVVSNSQLSGNLANYVTGTNLTNNLANYQTTADLSANVLNLTANNTTWVGSVTVANVVSNAQLQGNLSSYVTSTNLINNLANYQTTAGLSSNVAKLTANDSTNFSGQPQSYYTNATNQTSGTLNYARIPANIVNTSSNFTISGIYTHSSNLVISSTAGIVANGDIGSAGQVLASNGTSIYWATAGGIGTVTQVDTGSGLTGGPITGTGTVSVLANTGIVSNSTGVFVNSGYIATLTANNTSFVGSVSAANVVSNAQLSANLANYVTGTNLTNNLVNYQTTAGLASNVATLTANNTSFVGSVTAANVVSNSQLQGNLANYVTSTNLTNNLVNYQTTAGLSANVLNLTANNTTWVGTVTAANVVSNSQLQGNLALYTTTTLLQSLYVNNTQLTNNLANYQTTAGLSANVAKLTANDSTNFGGQLPAYYTDATNISTGTLNYARIPANIVNTTANFTISGIYTLTSNLIISNTTSGIIANGSIGSAGQVLTSNGSTVYWSTAAAGGFTNGQSISVNNIVITGAITANSSNGVSGQVLTSNGSGAYWSSLTGTVATITRQTFTATEAQNNFVISGGYTANNIDVYYNGVKLVNAVDVDVSSGANVRLQFSAANNAIIDVVAVDTPSLSTLYSYITGNSAVAYSNSISALSGNLVLYVNTTNLTNNLANYQTISGLQANLNALHVVNTTGSFVLAGNITVNNANLFVSTNSSSYTLIDSYEVYSVLGASYIGFNMSSFINPYFQAIADGGDEVYLSATDGLLFNNSDTSFSYLTPYNIGTPSFFANSANISFLNTSYINVNGTSINSTVYTGKSNNSTYLNGQLASYYTNSINISTTALSNGILYSNGTTFSTANVTGGIEFNTSILQTQLTNVDKSGDYTIVGSDRGKIINFIGSSASTITLTAAATVGAGWWCILKNNSTGTTGATKRLSISGTLDGVLNPATYPGDIRILTSDGSNINSILLQGGYLQLVAADSTFTLILPTGATTYKFAAWGGGGGGGSGRRGAAAAARAAGSGGGGGGYAYVETTYAAIGAANVSCIIAATASGGPAITVDTTNGTNGNPGVNTVIGTIVTAYGGGAGFGGLAATNSGGAGGSMIAPGAIGATAASIGGGQSTSLAGHFAGAGGSLGSVGLQSSGWGGAAGGGSSVTAASGAGGVGAFGGRGGGSGGCITAANISSAGGAGGGNSGTSGGGGAAGATAGSSGTAGTAGPSILGPGTGGGGGFAGANTGGVAGSGGGGGIACGGGGGGASLNGSNSGAGGIGGAGLIRFWYT